MKLRIKLQKTPKTTTVYIHRCIGIRHCDRDSGVDSGVYSGVDSGVDSVIGSFSI